MSELDDSILFDTIEAQVTPIDEQPRAFILSKEWETYHELKTGITACPQLFSDYGQAQEHRFIIQEMYCNMQRLVFRQKVAHSVRRQLHSELLKSRISSYADSLEEIISEINESITSLIRNGEDINQINLSDEEKNTEQNILVESIIEDVLYLFRTLRLSRAEVREAVDDCRSLLNRFELISQNTNRAGKAVQEYILKKKMAFADLKKCSICGNILLKKVPYCINCCEMRPIDV